VDSHLVREVARYLDASPVIFLRAMGCVQTEYVNTGIKQLADDIRRVARRPQRRYDFGGSHLNLR
jgi:hypothetical protein